MTLFNRKGRLYLVFEYIDKNLLEVLEENANGIDVRIILFFMSGDLYIAKTVKIICLLNDQRCHILS